MHGNLFVQKRGENSCTQKIRMETSSKKSVKNSYGKAKKFVRKYSRKFVCKSIEISLIKICTSKL